MKPLIIGLCLIACILPAIAQSKRSSEYSSSLGGVTNYNTGDGTERHEELDAEGTIKGHYSYIDPNGKKVRVSYSAGKDGFKASGPHFASFNIGSDADDHDDAYEEHEAPTTYYHQEKPVHHEPERPQFHRPEPPTYHHKEAPQSYHHQESKPVHHEPEPVHTYHHEDSPPKYHHQETPSTYHHEDIPSSHVNHVNHYPESHDHYEEEEEEEEEEEVKPVKPIINYSFKPTAPKFPSRPTFKPYTVKPEVHTHTHVDTEPIKTKFSIKHPPAKPDYLPELEDDEEYVAVPIPKNKNKFTPSSVDFPSVKTKTTYTVEEFDGKPVDHHFESGDHQLTSFDTTKLLEDYHKNKPSVSKLPSFPTTKFTIEDASGPHHHPTFPSKSPKFPEFNLNKFKPSSPKFPGFKTEEHFDFKPTYKVESTPHHFNLDATPSKGLQKLLEEQEKSKDELFHASLLNNKNPASVGQYQQYLKSKEDEKIEQAFLREQLKLQHSGPKKRPFSRPPPNKLHPGRRPPKRPSATPGLGSYRTTSYKIPYGFHFKIK